MGTESGHEKRRRRRIPLFENDGVYCLVVRAKSADRTIALAIKDFNESGFRLALAPHTKDDFFEGEKLYLKAITGSRNLTFKESVELRIRWKKLEDPENLINLGCEIFNITARTKRQFIEFIHAEERFRGLYGNRRSGVASGEIHSGQKSAAVEAQQKSGIFKAVSIFGGPRFNGNTARITEWVEETLAILGHQVERINLFSKKVNGCLGCLQCKDSSTGAGCVQKDDATDIIHKMVASDIVIYASPLYHWSFSAQMKALIDRCHCLNRGLCGTSEHSSFIEGQRQALIVTTDGPFENNAEHILTTFHRMLLNNKAHSAGELFVCNCSTPDALSDDIKAQATKFAGQLSGAIKTPYSILIPGSV